MSKILKHDRYLQHLCERLQPQYHEIYTNVALYSTSRKPRVVAEIDILARRDDGYDVYEVKCSHRLTKARKQLKRICRIIPDVHSTYFFCGESGKIETVMRV